MTLSILVIKHGALGDIVLATGPFAAIRAHHPGARIVALTTPAFAPLMEAMPWFDEVWTDPRARPWQLGAWLRLRTRLRAAAFARVYDLQTSGRSSAYFRWIFGGRPAWSGIARGASLRHDTPERTSLHTIARQKQQLAIVGIADVPPPDVSFLWAGKRVQAIDLARFKLPARYALLVPGGSAHRPQKRWRAEGFADAAQWFAGIGITPLLIGAAAEKDELALIAKACPMARNLCGKTRFEDIAVIAKGALLALGNDTGPMHLIAAAGCPTVTLFSSASDPERCAPVGAIPVKSDDLQNLESEVVIDVLRDAWVNINLSPGGEAALS